MVDAERFLPLCQDLSFLLSFRLLLRTFLSVRLQRRVNARGRNKITNAFARELKRKQTLCWPPYCWVMLVRTFFFLASSSCFLRASSCSFLSFSSWDTKNKSSSKILIQMDETQRKARLLVAVFNELTARRACLSFSCSARILCCSALSARRFS